MYNLLIVDDEHRVREGLRKLIDWGSVGFQVSGDVESAEQALEFIKANKTHVVLTDIIMYEINGIELVGKLNECEPGIKTVILSGFGEFHYAQQALRLGAYDYLTKPVDFDELKRIFAKIKLVLDEEMKDADMEEEYARLKKEKFLINLIKGHDSDSNSGSQEERNSGLLVEKAKQYIHENYARNMHLQMLSDILYIHPNYLSKLFKEKTGVNFIDYLTRVRIEKSKELIKDVNLKIYEIAEMTGFSNAKYFSSTFKALVGLSPREYKDSLPGIEE
ncbi:response regulator transcription factor [Paenibacillus eucommiae]|uniref:YesN/AraC family two-component response regulator n=1 Tax=Paenibacillus eucommiae TaxID=1355755 RepID=A0ABS4J3N6_9BACL|nr:response regulator [Paenibacillus eucommiae]MBP1994423.1 YesN/AraC family two-component response regulator [Paenibacillus eucommiae]